MAQDHQLSVVTLPYRRNVGIVLVNASGQIFVGKRHDQTAPHTGWQMPQGGIDEGEAAETALWRELKEETGVTHATLLAQYPDIVRYEFPPDLQPRICGGLYRGQEQDWFLLRLNGDDSQINLAAHDEQPAEFSAYDWRSAEEVIALAVPFKRDIYQMVLTHFMTIIAPH